MSQHAVAPLPYSGASFVDREEEIRAILAAVSKTRSAAYDRPRTVAFSGERGVGKSWLCLHLKRSVLDVAQNPDVLPLLVRFVPSGPESLPPADDELAGEKHIQLGEANLIRKVLIWVAGQVGATTTDDASLIELSTWLARGVENNLRDRILVLILDSVFELDWDVLDTLEKHLLVPLAGTERTLIVMTGRGQPYPWKSAALHPGVEGTPLGAFTEQDVKKQVASQVPGSERRVREIKQLGGGYPLNNYILATIPDPSQALADTVDMLLSVIPAAQRHQMKQYLEALCVLDGFRGNEIARMLIAYHGKPEDLASYQEQEKSIRNRLLETRLVHWETGRFVIDRSVSIPLENSLRMSNSEVWRRLQCAAYRFYQTSAALHPQFGDVFTARAESHADKLRAANLDPEQCPWVSEPA
jgi:hypothetical protein